MDALTIHEAAETTGWSPRMLRYIESSGLIEARRSPSGYRLYGPEELQRLRTLRELLDERGESLQEVGFALRLRRDEPLAGAGGRGWPPAQAPRGATRGRGGGVVRGAARASRRSRRGRLPQLRAVQT